jgi:hypothetical protein
MKFSVEMCIEGTSKNEIRHVAEVWDKKCIKVKGEVVSVLNQLGTTP